MLKVHLSAHPEVYSRVVITGDKVNKNLLFDSSLQHLYITTEKKVKLTQTWTHWSFFFFTKSISLSSYPSNTSVSPHIKKVRDSVMCLLLLFHFIHHATSHLFWPSYLIIYSFVRLTPIHPSALPHRSQPLIYSLILFSLHLSFSSFVLSSFGRHHSLTPHRSEIDVIDSEMN